MLGAMRTLALDYLFQEVDGEYPPDKLDTWYQDLRANSPEKLFRFLVEDRGDGSLIYNYPLIQYQIIKGNGFIVGLWKGAVDVVNAIVLKKRLNLGNEEYIVEQQEMSFLSPSIGSLDRRREYKFLTPWLGLNEKNYEKYQRLGSQVSRKEMLERILVGNIISMSKGLGYTVPALIRANILKIEEIQTSLKHVDGMRGSIRRLS